MLGLLQEPRSQSRMLFSLCKDDQKIQPYNKYNQKPAINLSHGVLGFWGFGV